VTRLKHKAGTLEPSLSSVSTASGRYTRTLDSEYSSSISP
jgi:hypothetical protein